MSYAEILLLIDAFAITLYGPRRRRHIVGQRVVSDISVLRLIVVVNLTIPICYYTTHVLETSVLLHIPNIT